MRFVSLNQTVAGATQQALQTNPSPDDNALRTLCRVWGSPVANSNAMLYVIRAGFTIAQIDFQRFAAGNGPVELYEQYNGLIQFQYYIYNQSGGSITVSVMFGYELGASPGSRPQVQ